MEVSWNCEVGAGAGKADMAMCGVSCEGWVVVDVDSRESVGGEFEFYRYSYSEKKVHRFMEKSDCEFIGREEIQSTWYQEMGETLGRT